MKISCAWLDTLSTITIGEVLNRITVQAENKPFIYFYDRILTFRAVHQGAAHWRDALWGHGFHAHERAVIFAENSPEWCQVYLAIVTAGGIAVPVDTHLKGEPFQRILEKSRAHTIVASAALAPRIKEVIDRLPAVRHVVILDGESGVNDARFIGRDAYTSMKTHHEEPAATPDDVCTILFTSGTTGEPKEVPLTHRNLVAGCAQGARLSSIHDGDCVLNPLPLYHIFPLVNGFLLTLCCGIGFSITTRIDRGDLMSVVTNHSISIFLCVPAFYEIMAQRIRRKIDALKGFRARFYRWFAAKSPVYNSPMFLRWFKLMLLGEAIGPWAKVRLFVAGGAPLNHDVVRLFNTLGLPLAEGYGLTETCGGVTLNTYRYHRVGSVGKLFSRWIEVRIDHPNEEGIGEIMLRGPTVMNGYGDLPREEAFTSDNFFHTGDMGFVDKDGFLFVTGRQKDIIVPSSGKNIYPKELEEHYRQSTLIKDICIFGLPEKGRKSETVHAAIIATDRILAHGEDVAYEWLATDIKKLSAALPSYKRIKSFSIWRGDFPKAGTAKVKKFEVRAVVMRHVHGDEEPVITVDDELLMTHPEAHYLCDLLLELAPRKVPLFPTTSLSADLGMDSLRLTELVTCLEKKYRRSFPREELASIATIKDAIAFLDRSLNVPPSAEDKNVPCEPVTK